ncbi:MAG: Na+/H+ antiporter NhaC [Flavobacteriales bacterium]|nr:Na+/H+ antiporter NhaC [Flavobacteriales bacterium]
MEDQIKPRSYGFWTALLPVAVLIGMLIYGMLIRPKVFNQEKLSLEFVFLVALIVVSSQLLILKHSWKTILKSMTDKINTAMPTLLILLAIGLIIGSWIVSGTIPMFVYYGIKLIHPDYIYLIAFVVPIVFSTMTGTSWGSVSTIGVVLIGVAISIGANLPIAAAAIIGGSFFGDKLSPLSDTTNIAALATEVSVYDHIKSMLYTTIPAALLACIFYFAAGFLFPADQATTNLTEVENTLIDIKRTFNFNILLILPPLVILIGSIRKMPTLPLLVVSSALAVVLGLIFQPFGLEYTAASLVSGFDVKEMVVVEGNSLNPLVDKLFSRGGMYSLKEPFIISLFVFAFVGALDRLNAMKVIMDTCLSWIKRAGGTVRAALISSAIVNSLTSNQYANSFIVGDAFKAKFDRLKIKRNVLSRSLEDTGTMLESLVPWHTTALYMASTLGVAVADYWYWQVFSLSNIVIAFLFTFFGIAIFKQTNSDESPK